MCSKTPCGYSLACAPLAGAPWHVVALPMRPLHVLCLHVLAWHVLLYAARPHMPARNLWVSLFKKAVTLLEYKYSSFFGAENAPNPRLGEYVPEP